MGLTASRLVRKATGLPLWDVSEKTELHWLGPAADGAYVRLASGVWQKVRHIRRVRLGANRYEDIFSQRCRVPPPLSFGSVFIPAPLMAAADLAPVTAGTNDGCVSANNASYTTARNATSGSTLWSVSLEILYVGQELYGGSYEIYRSMVPFDATALPDADPVKTAHIHLRISTVFGSGCTIHQVSFTGSNPVVIGDYDLFGIISRGSVVATTTGDKTLTLTDFTDISKTAISKLGFKAAKDVSATAPTGEEWVSIFSANSVTSAYRPVLDVTYGNIVFTSSHTAMVGGLGMAVCKNKVLRLGGTTLTAVKVAGIDHLESVGATVAGSAVKQIKGVGSAAAIGAAALCKRTVKAIRSSGVVVAAIQAAKTIMHKQAVTVTAASIRTAIVDFLVGSAGATVAAGVAKKVKPFLANVLVGLMASCAAVPTFLSAIYYVALSAGAAISAGCILGVRTVGSVLVDITGTCKRAVGIPWGALVSMGAQVVKKVGKGLSGLVSIVGVGVKWVRFFLVEAVTAGAFLAKKARVFRVTVLLVTGDIGRGVLFSLAASVTVGAFVVRKVVVFAWATVVVAGIATRRVGSAFIAGIVLVGQMVRWLSWSISTGVGLAALAVKGTWITLQVAPVGVSAMKQAVVAFLRVASVGVTGWLGKQVRNVLAALVRLGAFLLGRPRGHGAFTLTVIERPVAFMVTAERTAFSATERTVTFAVTRERLTLGSDSRERIMLAAERWSSV